MHDTTWAGRRRALRAAAVGGTVAVLGAAVVSSIAARTGWLDGWSAVAVGVLTGLAVALGTGRQGGRRTRWAAAALALGAVLLSAGLTEHATLELLAPTPDRAPGGIDILRGTAAWLGRDPTVLLPWSLAVAAAWRLSAPGT